MKTSITNHYYFSTKIIQAFPNLLLFCSTDFSGIRKKINN